MKRVVVIVSVLTTLLIGVEYDNPIHQLGSSAGTIAKGSALFHRSPLSILEHEVGSRKRLGVEIFQVDSMNSYSTMALGLTVPQGDLSWMLGYSRSGDDEIPYTSQSGIDNEHIRTGRSYGLTKAMMKVGLSHDKDGIRKGIGLSMYQTKVAEDSGQGFGLSMSYGVDVQRNLTILASIENAIATKMSYKEGEEVLSRRLSIGVESRVLSPFQVNLGVSKQFSELERDYLMNAGLSYAFNGWIWLSGAYYERYAGLNKKEYLSMGVGISLFQLSVSYAYRVVEYREADIQHYISVRLENTKKRDGLANGTSRVREDYRRRTNQRMRRDPISRVSKHIAEDEFVIPIVPLAPMVVPMVVPMVPEVEAPKKEQRVDPKQEETETIVAQKKESSNVITLRDITLRDIKDSESGGLFLIDTEMLVGEPELKRGIVIEEVKEMSLYEKIQMEINSLTKNKAMPQIVSIGNEG